MCVSLFFFFYLGLWVDDEAVYVCEAHNVFGKIEAEARITVTGLGRYNAWRFLPDSLVSPFSRLTVF